MVLEELPSRVIESPSIDTSLFEQAATDNVNNTSSDYFDPYTTVLRPVFTKLYVFHTDSNISASSPSSIAFHSAKQISPTVAKGRSGTDNGDRISPNRLKSRSENDRVSPNRLKSGSENGNRITRKDRSGKVGVRPLAKIGVGRTAKPN